MFGSQSQMLSGAFECMALPVECNVKKNKSKCFWLNKAYLQTQVWLQCRILLGGLPQSPCRRKIVALHGISTQVRGGLGAPTGGLRKVRPVEGNFHSKQGWACSVFSFRDVKLLFYVPRNEENIACQLRFKRYIF